MIDRSQMATNKHPSQAEQQELRQWIFQNADYGMSAQDRYASM
jgi:hypothetical protein